MKPVGQLLDAVLKVIHPQLYEAHSKAAASLLNEPKSEDWPFLTWPFIYSDVDIIANRSIKRHRIRDGADTFYDHLLSLGEGHNAQLHITNLQAEFEYQPGTSVLFPGKILAHSVPSWTVGERVVIALYGKDDVHNWLQLEKPILLTQSGWWIKNQKVDG